MDQKSKASMEPVWSKSVAVALTSTRLDGLAIANGTAPVAPPTEAVTEHVTKPAEAHAADDFDVEDLYTPGTPRSSRQTQKQNRSRVR